MEKLLEIFKARFERDLSEGWPEIQDEHLLGYKLGMQAGDLLYLFFDIEKKFGITIPEEQIISGQFSSLRNIAGMIRACRTCAESELDANTIANGAKVSC